VIFSVFDFDNVLSFHNVFLSALGDFLDEGFGKKSWNLGAGLVAIGHASIWERISKECGNGELCMVAEDDVTFFPFTKSWIIPPSDTSFLVLRSPGISESCLEKTKDIRFDRVRKFASVEGFLHGTYSYGLTGLGAQYLLTTLPMNRPVDHHMFFEATRSKSDNRLICYVNNMIRVAERPVVTSLNLQNSLLGEEIPRLVAEKQEAFERGGLQEERLPGVQSDPLFFGTGNDVNLLPETKRRCRKCEKHRA